MPSDMGRWKALRPEISPIPPARLLITAVRTASARSFLPEAELVRPCFSLLRRLRDKVNAEKIANIKLKHLSMGMTNDFEVAIEEGATFVRIGRAIFGEREK